MMAIQVPQIPKTRLIIAGVIGLLVVFGALVFLGVIPGLRQTGNQTVTLTFWGVDEKNTIDSIVTSLGKTYRVTYRSFPEAEYETELVNALAEGRGPDVFMIRSSWLPKHSAKLIPAPEPQLSLRSFQALYPTVVEQDFAPDGLIYAVPLSLDTLSLFYNSEFFDSESIANPPSTWTEFQESVTTLRRLDASQRVVRAGAAIGGTKKSVENISDILSALFIQSGAPMVREGFRGADFARDGASALSFYTSFANPSAPLFTWNDSLPEAVEAFSQERTAMMLGYASDLEKVLDRNQTLPVKVAPLPQPANAEKKYTVADYWGIGVSKNFLNPSGAWSFALALAANPTVAERYSNDTGKPPALRQLITQKINDPRYGVFSEQAFFARSWPQPDPVKVSDIFSEMVGFVLAGKKPISTAIGDAETSVGILIADRNQF